MLNQRTVTKLRLYTFLTDRGFLPLYDRPDVRKPKYRVWIYENTCDLVSAIEDYYSSIVINKK